jgi:hypothetical protein
MLLNEVILRMHASRSPLRSRGIDTMLFVLYALQMLYMPNPSSVADVSHVQRLPDH